MLVMHQPMDDDFYAELGAWIRETVDEVRGTYDELFLRDLPTKEDVQAWVRSWLLGEAPKMVWHNPLLPDFPAYPGPPKKPVELEKKQVMWDYEEMQRRRAEESLAAQRENLEKGSHPGDHDKPHRLVSPFLSGMADDLIRLIGRVGRGEIGGPEDGALDEGEVDDDQAQEA